MYLLGNKQMHQLKINGLPENTGKDHCPVSKISIPSRKCTWLLTEMPPNQNWIAYGLLDLGISVPEVCVMDLREIYEISEHYTEIERDIQYRSAYALSVHFKAALHHNQIVEEIVVSTFITHAQLNFLL